MGALWLTWLWDEAYMLAMQDGYSDVEARLIAEAARDAAAEKARCLDARQEAT